MEDIEDETDLVTQQILLASAHHDLESLRTLFRAASANVQDAETGTTPLHAAISACAPDTPDAPAVAAAADADDISRAERTLKLLFQNGAVWNELDGNMETPGCLARRLGLTSLYDIVVDAGVRAELLFMRLDEYAPLAGDDDDDDEDEDIDADTETDASADPSLQNPTYLSAPLQITADRVLDTSSNGVMMSWESPIMRRSAAALVPTPGLSVLNIGHGLGLVDGFLQEHAPAQHHIIEAHPDVLRAMRGAGWFGREGVSVHEGTWQDVVPRLVAEGVMFDAIYFDTFAEDYAAFKRFFGDGVIGLLKPEGRWGFFHGLGADRQVCYDVYTKVVEMDLFEAGYDVEWEVVKIADLEQSNEWDGVRRRYWTLDEYRLPTCTFVT